MPSPPLARKDLTDMKKIVTLLLTLSTVEAIAQQPAQLSIEQLMRDPKWIGTSPSGIRWSDDSRHLYFNWNPERADQDELYRISTRNTRPQKLSIAEQRLLAPACGSWNSARTKKLYEKNGDLCLLDIKKGKTLQLTCTTDSESNPVFSGDENQVIFTRNDNLYALNLKSSALTQLSNFVRSTTIIPLTDNPQAKWLKAQQLELFALIRQKKKADSLNIARKQLLLPKPIKETPIGQAQITDLALNPDKRYISYCLVSQPEKDRLSIVPDYVTASGFTEAIEDHEKVGGPQPVYQLFLFDRRRDTVYRVSEKDLPGIKDLPDYLKDYPAEKAVRIKLNADRKVSWHGPFWSRDGQNAVVEAESLDKKDRWIMQLDPATGNLRLLDREHSEAWIGGPGRDNYGWTDNTHFYFQSEKSGYAHIYLADVLTGKQTQLTGGNWEVQTLQLSNDKKTFYFTANKQHPGITHFYRIPVTGGTPVQLTSMTGVNRVILSPDEKWLAIRYSYTNKPWELYLQPNKPGATAVRITNSVSPEFSSYPWQAPQIVTFTNQVGKQVYARVYRPERPDPAKPAVLFVHGGGYLQNVTYGWSMYFREYLFHNFLADHGYYVMDIDYSASAGYGRDWRTAIYRHPGGADLGDEVDGVNYLATTYGVNPKHIGIYGGSYGGSLTLMAMFTRPDVFAAGAAVSAVTDWAHYGHDYTDEMLNEPYNDEKAYRQSSPIYHAAGLKGHLLMLHGMADQNVNFQDIVRLSERLIELHKENWWLVPYPVEDHVFKYPSSCADEFKRIYTLFEETLKN